MLQGKQELGAAAVKYFPGIHVWHLADVPSRHVKQSA
jgi:hypothetical protein